jgi:hypothetical protein
MGVMIGDDPSGLEGWRKGLWKAKAADFCGFGRVGRVRPMFDHICGCAGACAKQNNHEPFQSFRPFQIDEKESVFQ